MSALHDLVTEAACVGHPALCPEVKLYLSEDLDFEWKGVSPPYWAVAWPGGQGLARHLLDAPGLVAGRSVLDLGCGSGLCAIAAAMSGARRVTAADIDRYACAAADLNARCNGVAVETVCADLVGSEGAGWDVVLAADLWYERFLAMRVNAWLRGLAAAGALVLVGDPGRAFLPRRGLKERARYCVPTSQRHERAASGDVRVYRLEGAR